MLALFHSTDYTDLKEWLGKSGCKIMIRSMERTVEASRLRGCLPADFDYKKEREGRDSA
jgi:hypothetical protein